MAYLIKHFTFRTNIKTVIYLEIGDSAMWRKWEARKPIVCQIVPDFVSDFGFAVTYNQQHCCPSATVYSVNGTKWTEPNFTCTTSKLKSFGWTKSMPKGGRCREGCPKPSQLWGLGAL